VQTIAEALGTKPRVLRVPPRLVRLGARIGTAARLPFDDDALGKLTETFVVDNARLRRALGLETLPTSTREGIRRAVTDARPMR